MTAQYNFAWDPAKAKSNLRKHRVSFELAATVFRDPRARTVFDEDHDEDEERWITLGLSETGTILVVVHTFQLLGTEGAVRIRLVSARRATSKETRQYEENS
ncbi:MAG: uncharacterized protein QOF89_2016 [Acidobacteriota bacterium]|jgi:uncharacterized DUF497 family protein|nr:uncharacterized protein [Acidobacteriota bacterium]